MHRLTGVRVLEVGEMVGVPYATKLLADLGAEVIKIESPNGDPARHHGPFPPNASGDIEQSGLFLGLNTNKKSVVLALDTEHGRTTLANLVAESDIVFHDLGAERAAAVGLDADDLLERHPSLVVCAITPYGLTGPQAEWLGEEINVVHGGGWGRLIPGGATDRSIPPLTVSGHTAHYQAATAGALAALACYWNATETGVGDVIDLSVMAHVTSMVGESFVAWSYAGRIIERYGVRYSNPWRIFECKDGLIFLAVVEPDQWDRLVDMMGRPEWALQDKFSTNDGRAEHAAELNDHVEAWTRRHGVDELFRDGQARRICFAPVFDMADLAEQDQLVERDFFHQVEHPTAGTLTYLGPPYKMTPDAWELGAAAPRLGEHNGQGFAPRRATATDAPEPDLSSLAANRRPLDGIRVLDFSWVWAGPYATMHLAQLGAEVIKVENAQRPSLGRRIDYHPAGVTPTLNTSGYFNQWDQGKKSIELDLKDPADLAAAFELVASADIVIDNYATGVMDRLGLGDDALRAANPDVIIVSITGFGRTGPMSSYMGYGAATVPLSGLSALTGEPGGTPQEGGLPLGDAAAGLNAAFAAMAGLVMRRQGDDAVRLDISLWEATAVNAVEAWMGVALGTPPGGPNGSRHPVSAPQGVFRCAGTDEWVSISCTTDEHWRGLATVLGDAVADDPRFATRADRKANEVLLEAMVQHYTADRDKWDVTRELQAAGVPAYPTLNCAELERNEQLSARDFWQRFDHPEVGRRTHGGVPWLTTRAPNGMPSRAPLMGEHTAAVLGTLDAALGKS
jgi:crotonobetainyl-CoA:carnitine CoA-transferase CaiB-like acyl-CoA transferase